MLGCGPKNRYQLVLAAHHSLLLCCVPLTACCLRGPYDTRRWFVFDSNLTKTYGLNLLAVGFFFVYLYLTDVLIALPLQEVDLFQELLLMVLELTHGDTGEREAPGNVSVSKLDRIGFRDI